MKITDFAIIFCFIFLAVSLSIDISQNKIIQADDLKTNYNEIMYIATEDATTGLIEPSDETSYEEFAEGYLNKNTSMKLNVDRALSCFYSTLFLNMGIENDKIAQEGFKAFLPVKIVIADDGYYINACEEVLNEAGEKENQEIWLPKKPYSYFDEQSKLVINFTLTDYVYIFDVESGEYIEGAAYEMEQRYPQSLLFRGTDELFGSGGFNETNFDKVRRQSIINMVRDDLEYYIYKNNFISKENGKSYTFNIPYISSDQWKNTIDNICFIAFLQGFSIGPDKYSTFGFGGSKLVKTDVLYATGQAFEDGIYHKKDCPIINESESSFGSNIVDSFKKRFEAAQAGYHPCSICNP